MCTDDKTFLQSPISTFDFRWRGNYGQRQDDDDPTIERFIFTFGQPYSGHNLISFVLSNFEFFKVTSRKQPRVCTLLHETTSGEEQGIKE